MKAWLRASGLIDRCNRFVGRAMVWPLLASVVVSAGNALSRKLFNLSSNAWIEIQWHLFAVAFLGCAGYVLLVNEHVRVDILCTRWSARVRAWIDLLVLVGAALPMTALFVWFGWDLFRYALLRRETYLDAGGLILWPIYLVMILGMALLGLQVVSEVIRRIAFLRGFTQCATLSEADLPPIWPLQGGELR